METGHGRPRTAEIGTAMSPAPCVLRKTDGGFIWEWPRAVLRFPPDRPYVAGILNVTPDSFSDGGRYLEMEAAAIHGLAMAAAGADIVDVGGQSTRPGHRPVSPEEELRRILPVLELLHAVFAAIETSAATGDQTAAGSAGKAAAVLAGASDAGTEASVSVGPGVTSAVGSGVLSTAGPATTAAAVLARSGVPPEKRRPALISLDTDKPEVAEAVLSRGLAQILNDESGGDPEMARAAARYGVPLILMHRPAEDSDRGSLEAVLADLAVWRQRCVDAGMTGALIALDPGLGFGKTYAENLALLRDCRRLQVLGGPVYIGASRKRFVGRATGEGEACRRLGGSLAAALCAAAGGAAFVRVHDVEETVAALTMHQAIREGT